ncbi:MAG: acyl-CoA desaturase [bacterium]|nr:acyl-CoA desaturase [bacterium]
MSTVVEPTKNRGPSKSKGNADQPNTHVAESTTLDLPQTGEKLRLDQPQAEDADGFSSLVAQKAAKKRDLAKPTKADRVRASNISWWAVGWLAMAHIVCLAAPFTFTWTALITAVVLHWVAGSLGICLGYHRLLTHTGMKTYNWVRYTFAAIGCFAGEGSPLDWVADHRKHHAHSDLEGDPHSPHDGGIWSHIFWLAFHTHNGDRDAYLTRWVPDLYKDPAMRAFDLLFLPIHIVASFALLGIGYAFGGWELGVSMLVWGMFVRLVAVLHATWMVNSASHMWGYQNYETTDDSRNNWLVAIVAYGEGWHNNHHAYPRMAKHGHKWWEFDITWQAIKLLRAVGLVWDVVDYRTVAEKKARDAKQSVAA